MNKFLKYFKTQGKRTVKHYPFILLFTAVLTLCIALFVSTMFSTKESENAQKMKVGITGDLSESYLNLGILAITSMDSSRFYVEFVRLDEEEARKQTEDGRLSGYIVFPEDFMESISYGRNEPLTFVSQNDPSALTPAVTKEIIQIVSKLVLQGQNGVYGMVAFSEEYQIPDDVHEKALEDLNLQYIDAALDREDYYDVTYVGLGDGISFQTYYICAFLILLLMLWGMSCANLLIKHDMVLPRILHSNGHTLFGMVMGDYLPYLLMLAINTLIVSLLGASYIDMGAVEAWIRLFPVVILISTMQFFFYELSSNLISGILLQLFVTVILSYASGLFYPIYSLPETIQKVGAILPTRVAFGYLSEVIQGKTEVLQTVLVWSYVAVFVVASVLVRQYKMRSNKYD